MKRILICTIIASAMATTAMAQPRAAVDFQLQRIATNFISSPQFTYTGAEQYQADQRERWLEMEVTFASAPEFTDELTLKYFILFNGRLLTGEVTHVNIAAARDNRSGIMVGDDSSETAQRCQRIVRRQQHTARGEAGPFFQMQIGDDEQALFFPEQRTGEIGVERDASHIQSACR